MRTPVRRVEGGRVPGAVGLDIKNHARVAALTRENIHAYIDQWTNGNVEDVPVPGDTRIGPSPVVADPDGSCRVDDAEGRQLPAHNLVPELQLFEQWMVRIRLRQQLPNLFLEIVGILES